ncbi:MAG TPA: hypothetical protein VF454_02320, partial [Gemmatimonadales bacterium]
MIPLPTRRWYAGALLLAGAWVLALIHPDGVLIATMVDAAWVLAFLGDAFLAPDAALLEVKRDPPAAFSVGRPLPIRYRWSNPTARVARLQLRETFPPPLFTGPLPVRRVEIPAGGAVTEWVTLTPLRRGEGAGGAMWIRSRGPLGLADVRTRRELPWS